MTELAAWKAQWIWGSGEESPRNEWRCFRKTFTIDEDDGIEGYTLKITADSRYALFVNGKQVGRGPVRSWPFELAYDEYEIGHLLKPGEANTVAVLVMHFGLSTFYYLRGRGGLVAQIEAVSRDGRKETVLATDSTWQTAIHAGHDPNASRMSCQHAFTEITDASAWGDSWTDSGNDEAGWEAAAVIGPVGMEPWVRLVERGIPHLTEEPFYPVRVETVNAVKPASLCAALDLRVQFVPESSNHANNQSFSGYLATVIRVSKSARATVGIVDDGRIFGPCSLNGIWYGNDAFTGELPERYLAVELKQGDNFFMMDVTGTSHGHAFHIGFHSDEPIEIVSPLGKGQPTPFVTIGPFDTAEHIDHQEPVRLQKDHPDFVRAHLLSDATGLSDFIDWVKPLAAAHYNAQDAFGACVWKPSTSAQTVPHALQNLVIANAEPSVLPLYAGRDTEMIVDFGRELSGYLSFELEAAAGTVIDLYGFEYMRDGRVQHTYQLDNTLRYTCRSGRQSYTSFVRRGLRYLMITVRGAEKPVKLYEVKLLQSNYPVAEIGRFQCSDPLLNDIWQMSRHTTRLCMEDTFVDCPAFEQTFWVGDARNEALVGYYTFGAAELVERCLRLVPGSSFQTPLFADQVPSGWSSVIPNWTFFWVTACLEHYRYQGKRKFAEEMWPHVKYTLDHYLQKLDERGLLHMRGWNLLDWAPFEQPSEGIVTPQTMFMTKALRDAAELAAAAGDGDTGMRYIAAADRLREAINAGLWDESRQAYIDCVHEDGRPSATTSMQTQVVACLCGIADGERAQTIERYMTEPPASFVQIGSPFMSFFYHEALIKLGRFDVMLADIRAHYGTMVEHDASACWEMYPDPISRPNMPTRSHCHAWSAGPAYFLGAYTLGVRGADPGWSTVIVEPQPAGLTWARGAVPLPGGGSISVSWRLDEPARRIRLRIEAPRSLKLLVQPPDGYETETELVQLG
ncbi:family 78 glycoside hydrolase catalytic domain [Paenibacillus sp. MBLB4367]|uniref:family 78 glycoside hydrolase catalytic domain n=1 Tax=Paenibacillus sp. MBLB4367 TaxID=3384767 RepID=UPI003908011F